MAMLATAGAIPNTTKKAIPRATPPHMTSRDGRDSRRTLLGVRYAWAMDAPPPDGSPRGGHDYPGPGRQPRAGTVSTGGSACLPVRLVHGHRLLRGLRAGHHRLLEQRPLRGGVPETLVGRQGRQHVAGVEALAEQRAEHLGAEARVRAAGLHDRRDPGHV